MVGGTEQSLKQPGRSTLTLSSKRSIGESSKKRATIALKESPTSALQQRVDTSASAHMVGSLDIPTHSILIE
jgi:hypothetical protein